MYIIIITHFLIRLLLFRSIILNVLTPNKVYSSLVMRDQVTLLTPGLPCVAEEMDCGVVQTDGPERTCSPSCEQRDAGLEGETDPASGRAVPLGRPLIKLPQRSDMICGFASLKGQRLSECDPSMSPYASSCPLDPL